MGGRVKPITTVAPGHVAVDLRGDLSADECEHAAALLLRSAARARRMAAEAAAGPTGRVLAAQDAVRGLGPIAIEPWNQGRRSVRCTRGRVHCVGTTSGTINLYVREIVKVNDDLARRCSIVLAPEVGIGVARAWAEIVAMEPTPALDRIEGLAGSEGGA
jgi:hypothetical protein